jgi:hypothetical protein
MYVKLVSAYAYFGFLGCVCMYIAGEGLKRPQHRDHPWSIVLFWDVTLSSSVDGTDDWEEPVASILRV